MAYLNYFRSHSCSYWNFSSEFGSALIASLSGNTEMGLGVVIGSNIWNVTGILGITSIGTGFVKTDNKSVNRDGLMALITGIILFLFMIYGFFI